MLKKSQINEYSEILLRDSEREPGMPEYSGCDKTMDGHDEQIFDLPSPSP